MKQLIEKNKILCVILLIVVIGIVVVLVKGFNVEISYKEHYRIIVDIKEQVNCSEIKKIADEVFADDETIVQPATKMKDHVSISVNSLTDENKTNLVNKLNEKYGLKITVDDLEIEAIPQTKLIDLIKPYIVPYIIATVIIAVYVAIRFRKLKSLKSVLKFLISVVSAELLMFSLIAIFRIPVGKFLASEIIIAYLIGSSIVFCKLEKNKSAIVKKSNK